MFFKPSAGSADLSQVTNVLGTTNGGTGLTLFAQGDMFFAASASSFVRLASGTSAQFLGITNGNLPFWKQAPGIFTNSFSQSSFTITTSASLVISHSLLAIPSVIQFSVVCTTNDGNFSSGEIVPVSVNDIASAGAGNHGIGTRINASLIIVNFGSNASIFNTIDPITTNPVSLTNANWKLTVKAYS